jgi:hypothetical protein
LYKVNAAIKANLFSRNSRFPYAFTCLRVIFSVIFSKHAFKYLFEWLCNDIGVKPCLTASIAGAAVASASLIKSPAPVAVAEVIKQAPANGGGYVLSEHVKQYYKTTLV